MWKNFMKATNPLINRLRSKRVKVTWLELATVEFRSQILKIRKRKHQIQKGKTKNRCFRCNKFGHMKKYCKNKTAPKLFLDHCFNCWRYGHKRNECRKPNEKWRNQGYMDKKTVCYRCNIIGHITRNCKSQNPNKLQSKTISIKCFNYDINGHIAKYCRYNKNIKNGRSSSEIKGIIKKNL